MQITLDEVRSRLPVSRYRLDDDIEVQASVQESISARVAELALSCAELKEKLAVTEARLAQEARDTHEKISVEGAKGVVIRSTQRQTLVATLQSTKHELTLWEGALEAWKSRGYSLKTLADLYASQYFALSSTSSRSAERTPTPSAESRAQARDSVSAAVQRRVRVTNL